MTEIQIDPEIANLCRSLTDAELAGLEHDLIASGRARKPLDAWGGILLDGHNRLDICTRLGLPYAVDQVDGIETREQAINWVISNQLNRRNLNPEEASYLRGRRYNAEKLDPIAGSQRGTEGRWPARSENPNAETGRTAERLSKEFGVNRSTVVDDGQFAAAVDAIAENVGPEVAREIRGGQTNLPKTVIREIGKQPPQKQAETLEKAKKDKKARVQKARQAKAEQRAIPADLGTFVMWLMGGSMHASRFKTGAALAAYAAQSGVVLRADHIAETHELLGGLIAALEADRAA